MINKPLTIIIPTFNNQQQLDECVTSLYRTHFSAGGLFDVIIVNNGHKGSCDFLTQTKGVKVLESGDNIGWMGALNLALKNVKTPYVMFLNDDVFFPQSSLHSLHKLLCHFNDPEVAAVGPSTNVVMGLQNIWSTGTPNVFYSNLLIFFCVVIKMDALKKVGGVDASLPGGDDFDLCMRFKDNGFKIVVDKNVFVYHHGFQTGNRVFGDHTREGGWNSYKYSEKVDHALIKKHGFAKWAHFMMSIFGTKEYKNTRGSSVEDVEGDIVRENIKGDIVVDLGCGSRKTINTAIGVDMFEKGTIIDTLGSKSVADIVCDIEKQLPFEDESIDTIVARHILEHMIDLVYVLTEWERVLKVGGRLIIAVPHNYLYNSIPVNVEHVHAFTNESIESLLFLTGFRVIKQIDSGNNISFVTVSEKI
jgi:GT2 family glycosyltransferase